MPIIHITEAMKVTICIGFTLPSTFGVRVSAIIGLTAWFNTSKPLLIVGFSDIRIFCGIVSALGIRLNTLSNENGKIRRKATNPHRTPIIHFGAFFRRKRSNITARTSQLAVMLIFRSLIKTASISFPRCYILQPYGVNVQLPSALDFFVQ